MNHLVNSAVPWSQRFCSWKFSPRESEPWSGENGENESRLALSHAEKKFQENLWDQRTCPYGTVNFVTRGISHREICYVASEKNLYLYKLMKVISVWRRLGSSAMNTSSFYVFVWDLFSWFSKEICMIILPFLSLHFIIQKTNPESWVFSRACCHRPLDVFASISDWLTWLPSLMMTGQTLYQECCFTTQW